MTEDEARTLLARGDMDYRKVVRPDLIGEDIAEAPDQGPRRWVIDFASMTLEDASAYPAALRIVREKVRPEREKNRDKGFRELWWQFGRPRGAMRRALVGRRRYLAGVSNGKRLLWAWQEAWTCPSNLTNVVGHDDDWSMGVLTSRAHGAWAWARSSTLKGDLRYTPTTVFATFPLPDPTTEQQRERVAEASRRLLGRRSEICLAEQIGLTTLYNRVDEGAYTDVAALHRELDEAVVACYGWPKSVMQEDRELVRRLTELNREIAEGGTPYSPFGYLGA